MNTIHFTDLRTPATPAPFVDGPEAARSDAEVIIDHLIYASYRANRARSPDIAYRRWSVIYDNIEAMEARYQSEQPRPVLAAA